MADDNLDELLDGLPSVIAIPLQELEGEFHPVVRLWRMCDAAEMMLRLVAAIGAAELGARGGIPDDLARGVSERIRRPTLGHWLELARDLARGSERVAGADALVPELLASVERALWPLLRGHPPTDGDANGDITESLLRLRNTLAHGAGFRRETAAAMQQQHRDRLLKAVRDLGWLRDVQLVARSKDGRLVSLVGPSPGMAIQCLVLEPALEAVLNQTGGVAIVRGGRALELWPLQAYAPPSVLKTRQGAASSGDEPVPLIYTRLGNRRVDFTALGGAFPLAELGREAVARLESLFRLNERRELRGRRDDDFTDELREESEQLVGRKAVLERIGAAVERVKHGVIWVHGKAGCGKSAVMARVATSLSQRAAQDRRVVAWRFRTGDARCNRTRFLRYAIRRLEGWKRLAATRVELGDDNVILEQRLRDLLTQVPEGARVLMVVDGVDEAMRVDPKLVSLIFSIAGPPTTWLCFGRPDRELDARFNPEVCERVFREDGLPVLSPEEVGEWLKGPAVPSRQRDRIVIDESVAGKPSRWVAEVTKRSECLAAYIALLIDDLRTEDVVAASGALPRGLTAYFDELLHRAGVDDAAATLPPLLAAVALAVSAPSAATLAEVLRRGGQLKEATRDEHDAIVDEAIARARVMLRADLGLEGAAEVFRPYHDELRRHLTSAPTIANARATAREGLVALMREPASSPSLEVRRHAWTSGVRQLIALGEIGNAISLATSLEHLMARLEDLGGATVRDVIVDLRELEERGIEPSRVGPWLRFLRAASHMIARGDAAGLLQAATMEVSGSPVRVETEKWLVTHSPSKPWLRRVDDTVAERLAAPDLVLDGHDESIVGIAVFPEGRRAVTAGSDGSVRVWDLGADPLGACLERQTDRMKHGYESPSARALKRLVRTEISVIPACCPPPAPLLQAVVIIGVMQTGIGFKRRPRCVITLTIPIS